MRIHGVSGIAEEVDQHLFELIGMDLNCEFGAGLDGDRNAGLHMGGVLKPAVYAHGRDCWTREAGELGIGAGEAGEGFGEAADVDREHGLVAAEGDGVEGARDDLLAGAGFTGDEDIGVRGDHVEHRLHGGALGDHSGASVAC